MAWKTLLVLGSVAALWLAMSPNERSLPAREAPAPRLGSHLALDDVAFVAQEADGSSTRVEIGAVRLVEQKVAFFRSPLLRKLELRDLRVLRNGALVESVDRLRFGPLTPSQDLPESLRDSAALTTLAQLATRR